MPNLSTYTVVFQISPCIFPVEPNFELLLTGTGGIREYRKLIENNSSRLPNIASSNPQSPAPSSGKKFFLYSILYFFFEKEVVLFRNRRSCSSIETKRRFLSATVVATQQHYTLQIGPNDFPSKEKKKTVKKGNLCLTTSAPPLLYSTLCWWPLTPWAILTNWHS